MTTPLNQLTSKNMKAHELRIGNLVEINNPEYRSNDTGKIARVVQISELKGDVYLEIIDQYEGYFGQFLKYISPIPLSEQWLLRAGFPIELEYECAAIEFKNGVYLVALKESQYTEIKVEHQNIPFNLTIVKYVHQLQNLYFALTGKELEFN